MSEKKEEVSTVQHSVYNNSQVIKKLIASNSTKKPLKIAFVDIDATLTGQPTVTKKARETLEALGYALVFVTARTEEMVMSRQQYEKSRKLGFTRPRPRLSLHKGKRTYIDPKFVDCNLVDPDIIIGSTGTEILVRQSDGGYKRDTSFTQQFHSESSVWRKKVIQLLREIDPTESFLTLAPIEYEENYKSRKTDIFPSEYRIKINFKNIDGKIKFLQEMEKRNVIQSIHHVKSGPIQPSSLRVIDDSHSEMEDYTLYLTPAKAYKGGAVDHTVDNICKSLRFCLQSTKITRADLNVILAGDSYPDLTMLLYGASGTKATAIVVGGSRLTRILTHASLHMYAGENISSLKKKLRLNVNKAGHYNFQTTLQDNEVHIRNIIFGDHAFPKTKGPETILAYLNEYHSKN